MYWDTSALLKLYVAEPDSESFLRLVTQAGVAPSISEVAKVEVLGALNRKEEVGDLKPGGAEALWRQFLADLEEGRIVCIPFSSDVVELCPGLLQECQARGLPLRSLDLIHLATAVLSRSGVLVTADTRLVAAATVSGLKTSSGIP